MRFDLNLNNESATIRFGTVFARLISSPCVMTFEGEIGSGKTSLIRAIIHGLGIKEPIKSPTFSLFETYSCPQHVIYHFDLYRIEQEEELEYIGFREYFSENALVFIEWPSRLCHLSTISDVHCEINVPEDTEGRQLIMTANSQKGKKILHHLEGQTR